MTFAFGEPSRQGLGAPYGAGGYAHAFFQLCRAPHLKLFDARRQTGQAFRRAAARRPTFLLAEKRGPKMRPSRVAHPAAPCGYAATGRVRLKAHPVPQPKPRDPSRGPQAAGPSSSRRHERAGELKATSTASAAKRRTTQQRCVRSTFIPFRGGEVAQESPQGGRMDSASSLQVQGCAFSEPRSQLAQSCGFSARPTRPGALSLGYVSLGKQRKVTRSTQSSESLCLCGRGAEATTQLAAAKRR